MNIFSYKHFFTQSLLILLQEELIVFNYTTKSFIGVDILKKVFFKSLVELTGHRTSSNIIKKFTSSRWSQALNKTFVNVYKVNVDEMEKPLQEYKSLQALFTRKLKIDARPVDPSANTIVSPVDGVLSSFGKVSEQDTFIVKGQEYSIEAMFGKERKEDAFKKGFYFLFYLSPTDYHRIHSPIDGFVEEQWSCGGKSYPVNNLGMKYGNKPLSTNYRLISLVTGARSKVAVIKVGALNINSIHLTHEHATLKKGNEMAYFSFGSTVVLFIEQGKFQIEESLSYEMDIQQGQRIGSFAQ